MTRVTARVIASNEGFTSLEVRMKGDVPTFCLVKKWRGGEINWLGPVKDTVHFGRSVKGEILLALESAPVIILLGHLEFISECPDFFQTPTIKILDEIFTEKRELVFSDALTA